MGIKICVTMMGSVSGDGQKGINIMIINSITYLYRHPRVQFMPMFVALYLQYLNCF